MTVSQELVVAFALASAILVVIGLHRAGLKLLVFAAFLPVLVPAFVKIFAALPAPAVILVLAIAGLVLLQVIAGIILGRHASSTMAGSLAADLVRIALLLFFLHVCAGRLVIRTISGG